MAPEAAMRIAMAADESITRQVRCTKRSGPRKLVLLGIYRHEMFVTGRKILMWHGGGT